MQINEHVPFPHPWPEAALRTVADVVVGGTPSTLVPSFWGGEIMWMSSGDVHLKQIHDVPGRITDEGLRRSNAKIVAPPAVAIALAGQGKTRGTAGVTRVPICTNQSVALVKNRNDELNVDYLFHNLELRYEELRARSAGGGRAGLSKSIIEALPVPLPTSDEQRKIAAILNVTDDTIRRTDRLVAKLTRIKQGVMQDLLTRGIDERGNIRTEKTHKFKDSPLGRIPEEWSIGNLRTFGSRSRPYLKTGPFGSSLKGEHWVSEGEGIPVVTIGALGEEEILRKELMYISQAKAKSLAAYALRTGDLMFSRVADVGRSIVIDEQQDGWIMSSNFMRIALDDRAAVPRFLHLNFKYNDVVLRQVRRLANAGGRNVVNSKILNSLVIPWPHLGEQERIVNQFAVMNQEIRNERDWLSKLQRLKHGLMADLLTGKVRVNCLTKQ